MAVDRSVTLSLARFCIAQHQAFDPDDWYARFETEGDAIAIAAKYLAVTGWYGHTEQLEHIAAKMHVFHVSGRELYREANARGLDLISFSVRVRVGIQAGIEQLEDRCIGHLFAPSAEYVNVQSDQVTVG